MAETYDRTSTRRWMWIAGAIVVLAAIAGVVYLAVAGDGGGGGGTGGGGYAVVALSAARARWLISRVLTSRARMR